MCNYAINRQMFRVLSIMHDDDVVSSVGNSINMCWH